MDYIGRYQIIERVGAGSFATVYRGIDQQLDVLVAVKVLAENWCGNPGVTKRFLTEAQMLRQINDERVVKVYDVGTTSQNQPYFVMDYCDGGSLEDYRKQLLLPGRALRLCAETARGVEVLHRKQVLHRDVTPANVLLAHSPHGIQIQLADLGVAKLMTEQQNGTMTAGTPAYMAIEQARGDFLDQRTDIYSLAALTYALLTGHPPFQVKTLNQLLTLDPRITPAPIAFKIAAPKSLDDLLVASLSWSKQDRPNTAAELAGQLDEIAALLPGGDSYTPRPLAGAPIRNKPKIVDSFGPAVEPKSGVLASTATQNHNYSSTNLTGSPSALSPQLTLQQSQNRQISNPIAPNETPGSMLENYLGPGRYQVKKAKEKYSASFYLIVAAVCLLVFGLGFWVVITNF